MAATNGDDELHLPRSQHGPNPQHIVITLLGDYWFEQEDRLPSGVLVDLVAEFGVTAGSARIALSRLARRGLLDYDRRGRNTFYGLTPTAEQVIRDGAERILSLGDADKDWDGCWTFVMFSIAEQRRDLRHGLRSELRWRGFGPLYDGAWVSPRADPEEISALLCELGVEKWTVVRPPSVLACDGGAPLTAWDLDGVERAYNEFIATHEPLLGRLDRGIGGDEALRLRTNIMDEWRHFPNLDPGLPDEALPASWPRVRAREIFAGIYDGLAPIAVQEVRDIIERHGATLGPPRYRTSSGDVVRYAPA